MRRIGEILVDIGVLLDDALNQGLTVQREKGGKLGEILLKQKSILEADLLKGLAIQLDMEFVTSLPQELNTDFTEKIPIHFLRKYRMVPVDNGSGKACVAVNDPFHFQPLDDLCRILQWENPRVVIASQASIMAVVNFAYDVSRDSAEEVIQDMHEEDTDQIISEIEEIGDLLDDTSDAPIIKLVNLMFSQAVRAGASDIHIEPYQSILKIRQRVDGVLYDMFTPPQHIQAALVSRIKIMAKLNIAEKRLPQDGRIEIRIADKNVDVRVSTLPTSFGERVVLRLLDKSSVILNLTDLGMTRERLAIFDGLIHQPHGIFLVTGPTGSGKTTTLYAALTTINKTDVNIITIEDPVEYQIEGIGQVQVNPKIDLTFANGLRSIVRQDPDVILVGEIRDLETAKIAIQSALTGHLVFSTLHTNDSASAVTRLTDMGIESFMVTSSVNAILAQRLVRLLCNECKEPYEPDAEAMASIGITPDMLAGNRIYREKGCVSCHQTGYSGRHGIFELMVLNDEVKSTVLKTSDANVIRAKSIEQGMITLRQDGVRQVLEGVTSVEEVFRVTEQEG
jgi:general secretion pathway protein E